MLFYIKAKVTLRVQGISGPWERVIAWLVNTPSGTVNEAKQKYEEQVKRDFAHMLFSSANFEYLEVTGEIK